MTVNAIKVKMTPSHPGSFIRAEVMEELGLNVTRTAGILGVRRATLSALLNGKSALSPRNGTAHREGIRCEYGYAAADAGLARCGADACPR